MSELSSYAKELNQIDLERYINKLTISVDGSDFVLPDPYNIKQLNKVGLQILKNSHQQITGLFTII
jgi:hypothetical protein